MLTTDKTCVAPSYRVIDYDPEQWTGSLNLFDFEARVVAPPLPSSREAKKADRFAQRWRQAQAALLKGLMPAPTADDALKVVQAVSDTFFNRVYPRKPKEKLLSQPENRFDPGTKFMRAIEIAAQVLFDPDSDGRFPQVQGIEALANDLLAFHARHHHAADPRFMPVNAMGQCLKTLVSIFRQAD
jgi:hypothetical protein